MKYRKTAIRLLVLGVCSYLLIYLACFAYIFINGSFTGNFEFPGLFSGYQLFVLGAVLFYFLPLTLAIRHHAKLAGMRWLKVASSVMIVFFFVWSLLCILAMCVTAINS